MKIRTQLVLAFLLLAVVPLAGIVLYSYVSSLRAVRRATETQAEMLTQEIGERMASIRSELGRGVERIGDVPVQDLLSAARSSRQGRNDPLLGEMVLGFGDAAPLVRSLEFIPLPATPPEHAAAAAPPAPPAAPQPPEVAPAQPPRRSHPVRRVVIDVPAILREARRKARAGHEQDPQTLAAIDSALKALADPDEGEEALPETEEIEEPPHPPEGPENWVSPEEIRKQVQEQLALQTEEHRKALEDLKAVEKEQMRVAQDHAEMERLVLGRHFEMPVREGGRVVGKVKARIRGDEVLRRVLARTRGGEGEIPFAVDAQGKLHALDDEHRQKLEGLHSAFASQARLGSGPQTYGYWAVATSEDPESGLVFGIARPMPLQEVRHTAARNFGYGLGMIGLALLGILPLSTRMTRNLKLVTEGADRIARGDLEARVPVRSRNEFGTLALTFNRMAEDLKRHQEREVEQALLQTEYERKTRELEEARRFQLSLLPKALPDHPAFEIAVSMRTATEVGGDYYDFHLSNDGALTVAIGDATGHGAAAGTMVTVVKSLFSADAGSSHPREFLAEAARAVKRMELGRMAMGLCLARLTGGSLILSSAGMPPVFVHRAASGETEEIALQGMPLGGLASEYQEQRLEMATGDTILSLTDGLPELTNAEGDPLGYPRVRSLFAGLGGKSPEEIIAGLTSAAETWTGGQAPKDDITLVVIRMRAA